MIWTLVVIGGGTVPQPTQIFGMIAVIFAQRLASSDNDGWAFAASGFAIAAAIGQIFIALYPNVMVSSTNHAYNLTVNNSAAGHYGLVVMTVVAVLFFPIVLLYQGWSFHVFVTASSRPPLQLRHPRAPRTRQPRPSPPTCSRRVQGRSRRTYSSPGESHARLTQSLVQACSCTGR